MAAIPECMNGSQKHLVKPATTVIADGRTLQLKVAKQILAEVFHIRLGDVEDMIMKRLGEKDRIQEKSSHANCGTWPEMFWVEVEDEVATQ